MGTASVEVCFELDVDTDGDTLLDRWETGRFGENRDGTIEVDFPAGRELCAETLFQSGTFMHEFGHSLGLDHGGRGDAVDNKLRFRS